MFILIILFCILGFFFRPFWIVALCLSVYFIATIKSRRTKLIEDRLKRMISAEQKTAYFPDLYYEAAKQYSLDKGASYATEEASFANIMINGSTYKIYFQRERKGTYIEIKTYEEAKLQNERFMNNLRTI